MCIIVLCRLPYACSVQKRGGKHPPLIVTLFCLQERIARYSSNSTKETNHRNKLSVRVSSINYAPSCVKTKRAL